MRLFAGEGSGGAGCVAGKLRFEVSHPFHDDAVKWMGHPHLLLGKKRRAKAGPSASLRMTGFLVAHDDSVVFKLKAES